MNSRRLRRIDAPVSTVAIVTFFATLLPPLPARADVGDTIGSSVSTLSLASSPPLASSTEALATVDLSTGAASATIPFQLPTARGRVQPHLALTYNSAAGEGLAGLGWTLDLPSIERRGASGIPKFVDDPAGSSTGSLCNPADPASGSCADRFYFAGMPLVPICVVPSERTCAAVPNETLPYAYVGYTYFRAQVDDGLRYFWSADQQRRTWVVQEMDGTTSYYGKYPGTQPGGNDALDHADVIRLPEHGLTDIIRWNLIRQEDSSGNAVIYSWQHTATTPNGLSGGTPGPVFLEDIYDTPKPGAADDLSLYAHHVHLRWRGFDVFGQPSTVKSDERLSSPIWRQQPALHLASVDVASKGNDPSQPRTQVRRYHLGYGADRGNTRPLLTSVQLEGACGIAEENGQIPESASCGNDAWQPQTTLDYTHIDSLGTGYQAGPTTMVGSYTPTAVATPVRGTRPYAVFDDLIQEFVGPSGDNNRSISMEARGQGSPRHASGLDIAPGAPHVIMGDWIGDGQLNALWMNINTSDDSASTFELYTVQASPIPELKGHLTWGGFGPYPFTPTLQQGGLTNAKGIDVDGDGLTDLGLYFDGYWNQNHWSTGTAFSRRDANGIVHPFAGRTVGTEPGSTGNPTVCRADIPQPRYYADFDGDGLADTLTFADNDDQGHSGTYVNVFKNRGDGRFGYGEDTNPPSDCIRRPNGPLVVSTDFSAYFSPSGGSDVKALHDLTGDGLADLIVADADGIRVWFQQHLGPYTSSFFPGPDVMIPASAIVGWDAFAPNAVGLVFADIDEDGDPDSSSPGVDELVVAITGHSTQSFRFFKGMKPGLLTSITSPTGATTTLTYQSVSHFVPQVNVGDLWNDPAYHPLPVPAYAVTKIVTSNGPIAAAYHRAAETDYTYDTPIYDTVGRAFLGFKYVVEKRPDPPFGSAYTKTWFATATHCYAAVGVPGCGEAADPYGNAFYRAARGVPLAVETFDDSQYDDQGNNPHLVTRLDSYAAPPYAGGLDGRIVVMLRRVQSDLYLWGTQDGGTGTATVQGYPPSLHEDASPVPIHGTPIRHTFGYDSIGNMTSAVDWGVLGVDMPIGTALEYVLPSTRHGWIYRVSKSTQGYQDAQGGWINQTRVLLYNYLEDGLPWMVSGVLTGSLGLYRANPTFGTVAPIPNDASVDSTVTLWSVPNNGGYDAYGNLLKVQTPNNRCVRFDYDADYSQLPIRTTRFLNGCDSTGFTETRVFDRGLERVNMAYSIANEVSSMYYDAFGRLTKLYRQDSSAPGHSEEIPSLVIDYRFADTGPVRKIKVSRLTEVLPQTYQDSWQYLDGFGNPLVSLRQAEYPGQWIVEGAHVTTSGRGLLRQAFEPFQWNGDAAQFPLDATVPSRSVTFYYDALGRQTAAVRPDPSGSVLLATYDYHADTRSVDVTDAEQLGGGHSGALTTISYDGHGRQVKTVQHVVRPSQDDITTKWTYQATGEVNELVRSHSAGSDSVVHSLFYDSLGRLVYNIEPNTAYTPSGSWIPLAWMYAYNDNGELVATSDARGCGENIAHDALGRVTEVVYSPCTYNQPAYRDPNAAGDGDNVAVRYVYDVPAHPNGVYDEIYTGKLTETYDEAQHSAVDRDPRGRPKRITRQLAVPSSWTPEYGGGSNRQPFATRYSTHVFQKDITLYDAADRVIDETTGASSLELAPPGDNGSWIRTLYTLRGTVDNVQSTYGTLLISQQFDPTGRLTHRVYGDAASTNADYTYEPATGRLQEAWIHRGSGPWTTQSGYTPPPPPSPSDPNTLQADVMHLHYTYDLVGNPRTMNDSANPLDWPDGAKPAFRGMDYDDTYRLRTVTSSYPSGDDRFVSPLEHEANSGNFMYPLVAGPSFRPRQHAISYDWQGNTTSVTNDHSAFSDGAIGAITNGAGVGPNRIVSSDGFDVQYDEAGNVVAIDKFAPDGSFDEFEYAWDEVGRLMAAARLSGSTADSHEQGPYIFFAYDSAGQRTLQSSRLYSYNQGQSTFSDPVFTAEVFNTLRIEDTTFNTFNSGDYAVDASTEVAYLVSNGERFGRAFYAPQGSGIPLSGQTHVYLEMGDHLGSTAAVIDHETGELVERRTHHPYGAVESDYRPDRWADFRDSYGHSSHVDLVQVGLVDFGARYYSPVIGRWISPDPLAVHGLGGDPNPYAFTAGSPMGLVDPFGLDPCDKKSQSCEPDRSDPADPDQQWSPPPGGYAGGSSGPSAPPQPSGHYPSSRPPPPSSQAGGGGYSPLRLYNGPFRRAAFQAHGVASASQNGMEKMFGYMSMVFLGAFAVVEDLPNLPAQAWEGGAAAGAAIAEGDIGGVALAAVALGGTLADLKVPLRGTSALAEGTTTLYHGTTGAAAARIRANGFRPSELDGAVFLAEDRATAEFFAEAVTADRLGSNPVVMKFEVPNSILGQMERGVIGEFRGWKFVDIPGSNGMERIMLGETIDVFNGGMKSGLIPVFRLRVGGGF